MYTQVFKVHSGRETLDPRSLIPRKDRENGQKYHRLTPDYLPSTRSLQITDLLIYTNQPLKETVTNLRVHFRGSSIPHLECLLTSKRGPFPLSLVSPSTPKTVPSLTLLPGILVTTFSCFPFDCLLIDCQLFFHHTPVLLQSFKQSFERILSEDFLILQHQRLAIQTLTLNSSSCL